MRYRDCTYKLRLTLRKVTPSGIAKNAAAAGGRHQKPWHASTPAASLSRAARLHCRGRRLVRGPYRARSLRRAKKRRDMAQETRDRAQRERVEKLKAALLRNEEIRQQSLQAQ